MPGAPSLNSAEAHDHGAEGAEREPAVYFLVEDLMRASRFSAHTIRKHLQRLGIAERIGGRIMASRENLREKWPSMYGIIQTLEFRA